MSRKTTAEKIAVMQAFLDGKEIEYSPSGFEFQTWRVVKEPVWNWEENDYRIKDEVVTYKRYLYQSVDGKQYIHTHHKGFPSPEICRGFIRWIDTDWQTV